MFKHIAAFVVLGGFLFYIMPTIEQWQLLNSPAQLHITEADVVLLKDEFEAAILREPETEELIHLVSRHIDDMILMNEAIRLNFHITDMVVRQRLLMNMSFLENADTEGELPQQELLEQEQRRFEQAVDLGMLYTDLIVQRRLRDRMEKYIQDLFQ